MIRGYHMQTNYISIFDGDTLIQQSQLCEMLNINSPVPGLKLRTQDIEAAYKKRIKRFQSKTSSQLHKMIPEADRTILLNDLKKARDYLLQGTDFIPGKQFCENIKSMDENHLINFFVENINHLSSYDITNQFLTSLAIGYKLSDFHDGRLSLDYINEFSDALKMIRSNMEQLKSNEQLDNTLLNYIQNTPSWSLIMSVYFVSLLYKAKNAPNFINAVSVIEQTIFKQKGTLQFVLFGLPLMLLSLPLYAINIASQLSYQFARMFLDLTVHAIRHGVLLLISLVQPLIINAPEGVNPLKFWGYGLLDHSLNFTVKLLANLTLSPLHSIFFILTSNELIGDIRDGLNENLDDFIEICRPISTPYMNRGTNVGFVDADDDYTSSEDETDDIGKEHTPPGTPNSRFFSRSQHGQNIHDYIDENDTWLKSVISLYSPDESPLLAMDMN